MGKGRKHRKEKAYKAPPSIPAIIYKAADDRTVPKEKPKLIPPDTFQTIAEEMLQTLPAFRNVFMTMCEYRIKDINPQHKETKESPTHMIIFCLRVVSSDQFHPLGVVQIDKRIDQTDKLIEVWKAFIYDLSLLRLIVIGSISPPSITFYKILSQLTKIPKLEEYSGPIVYSVWPFKEIVHLYDYYHLLQETQETLFERTEMCFMAYPPSEETCPLELWKATWTDILLVLASQGIYCYYTTEDENAPPIGIFFADFYKHYQKARRDGVVATETRTCTDRLMEIFCPFTTLLHSHKSFMTPSDLQHFYETNEELRWLLASAKFRKLNPSNSRRTMPAILRKNYCKVSNELLNVPSNYKPKSVLDEMSFSAESSPPSSGSIEITESQMETLFKLIDHNVSNQNNHPTHQTKLDPFDVFLKKVTYDDYDLFLKTSSKAPNAQSPKSTNNEELTQPYPPNATKTPISDEITKRQLLNSSTTKLTNKESTNSEIHTKAQPSKSVNDKDVTKPYTKVSGKKATKPQQPNDVRNKSSPEQVRPQSSKAVGHNRVTKPQQPDDVQNKLSSEQNRPQSSKAANHNKVTKPQQPNDVQNKLSSEQTRPQSSKAVNHNKVTKPQQPNDVPNKLSPEQNRPQSSKAVDHNKVTKPHRSRSQELNGSQKSSEKLFKPYSSQTIDDKDLIKSEPTNAVSNKQVTKANKHEESSKAQSKKSTKSKPVNDVCSKEVTKEVSDKESKTVQSKEVTKSKQVNNVCNKEVDKSHASKEVSHKESKTAQNTEETKSKSCDKKVTKLHAFKEVRDKGSKTAQSTEVSKSKSVSNVCDKKETSKEVSHKESKTARSKEVTKSKQVNNVCNKETAQSKEITKSKPVTDVFSGRCKTAQSKDVTKSTPVKNVCNKDVTKPHTSGIVSHKEVTEPQLLKSAENEDENENSNKEIILHDHDYFHAESSRKHVKKRASNSTIYNLVKDYFGEAINQQINIGNSPKKLSHGNVGDLLANTNKSHANLLVNDDESTQDSDTQPHLIVDTKKLKNNSDINIDLSGVLQTITEHYPQKNKMELKISVVNSLDKTCKFLNLSKASIIQNSKKTINKGTSKTQNKKKTESIQSIHIPKGMRGKKWKARRIKARQHAHRLVFNASQIVPVKVKKRRNNWTKINRTFIKAKQRVLSDSNSSDDCENKKTDSLKTALKTDEFSSRLLQRKRKDFVKQRIRQLCFKSKNSTSRESGYQTDVLKGKSSTVRENEDNKTGSRRKMEKQPLSPKKSTNTSVSQSADNTVESSLWPKTNKTYKNSKRANRNKVNLDVKNVDRVGSSITEHFKSETSTDSIPAVNTDSEVNVDIVQNKNIGCISAKNKDADSTVVCKESNENDASKTSKDDELRTNGDVISEKYRNDNLEIKERNGDTDSAQKSNEDIASKAIKNDDPETDKNIDRFVENVDSFISKTNDSTEFTANKELNDSKISKNIDSATTSKNNGIDTIEEIKFEINIISKPVIGDHPEINDESDSSSSDLDSIDSLEELAVSLENKKNPSKRPSKYIIPKIPRVSLQTTSQNNDPKVKRSDECKPLAADLHNGFGTFTNGNRVNGYGKCNGAHSGDSADSESHESFPEKKILGVDDQPDKSRDDNTTEIKGDLCNKDLKACLNGNLHEDKDSTDSCNTIDNNSSHSSKLKRSPVQIQEDEKYNCSTSHVDARKAIDRIKKAEKSEPLMDSSIIKNDDDFYSEAKDIFEASQRYTTGEKEQISSFLDLIESTVTDGQNVKNVLEEAENICRGPPNSDNNVLSSVEDDSSTPNVSKGDDVTSDKSISDIVIKSSVKKNKNKMLNEWKDVIVDVNVDSLGNDITGTDAVLEKGISNEPQEASEIDYFSDDSLEIEIPSKPVSNSPKPDSCVIDMDNGCVGNSLSASRKSMSEDSIDKLDTMNTVVNKCSGIVEDSFNNLRSAVYILQEISELNRSIVNDKGTGSSAKGVRGPADILRDLSQLNQRAITNGETGAAFSKMDINNHISNINKKLAVNNSFLTASGLKNDFFESIDYKEYKRSLEVCDNRESNCDIIYKDRETFKALYGRIPDDFETLRLSNDWLSTLKGYVKLKEILTARKVKCFHATALNLEHVDFFVHLIKKSKNQVPSTYHGQTYRFLDYRCAFDLLTLGNGVYVVSKDDDNVVGDKVS